MNPLPYYVTRLAMFGPTPKGVGWVDDSDIIPCYAGMRRMLGTELGDSVLDVGCGVGLGRRFFRGPFFGCDLHGRALRYCDFPVVHGTTTAFDDDAFDYVVMHGTLNVGYDDFDEAWGVVREARRVARCGMAFTVEPCEEPWKYENLSLFPLEAWRSRALASLEKPLFRFTGRYLIVGEKRA